MVPHIDQAHALSHVPQSIIHCHAMEQSIFRDASTFSASRDIPRILWNPKTHYRGHNNSPPSTILSQVNSYSVSQVN